jgi:hypothetical protein
MTTGLLSPKTTVRRRRITSGKQVEIDVSQTPASALQKLRMDSPVDIPSSSNDNLHTKDKGRPADQLRNARYLPQPEDIDSPTASFLPRLTSSPTPIDESVFTVPGLASSRLPENTNQTVGRRLHNLPASSPTPNYLKTPTRQDSSQLIVQSSQSQYLPFYPTPSKGSSHSDNHGNSSQVETSQWNEVELQPPRTPTKASMRTNRYEQLLFINLMLIFSIVTPTKTLLRT